MAPATKTMLPPKPGKESLLIPRTRSVNEALAGVHKAGGYTGFLGEGNVVKKPDYEIPVENLTASDKARKQAIASLLMDVIEPVQLSSKSTVEMDRRSLLNKIKKQSLEELRRFLPTRVKHLPTETLQADQLSEDEKAEIQDNYKEISP